MGGQLRGTLARSAPYILAAAAAAEPEWDLRPALLAASRDAVRARAQGAVGIEEYLGQGALLADAGKAIDGVPMGEQILRLLWTLGGKPVVFSRVIRAFLAAARSNPRGQGALFPGEKVTPLEALDRAVQPNQPAFA